MFVEEGFKLPVSGGRFCFGWGEGDTIRGCYPPCYPHRYCYHLPACAPISPDNRFQSVAMNKGRWWLAVATAAAAAAANNQGA